ncbi:MAG: hypothetical protein KGM16_15050 [Bacteroidota bacterium]|nr:hypothetical protein [Bacteroidota bacterium]
MRCTYWPAPCQNTDAISTANDWTTRMKDNIALIQELKFEKKMRLQLYNILAEAAKRNHWELYELTEEAYDGPPSPSISYEEWESTPYEKRPPASVDITFIILVNKDSLSKWKNWEVEFQSKMDNSAQQYNSASEEVDRDPLLQAYSDSEDYYIQQQTKYLDDHQDQYLKDIKNNNTAGIKEREKKLKWFSYKMNYFLKKSQDVGAKSYTDATQSMKNVEDEFTSKTKLFTEASIVLVHIMVNPDYVKTGLEDPGQRSLVPQQSLNISGASYAGLLINPDKDTDEHAYVLNYQGYIFENPASVGMIRFGQFLSADSYNNYRPLFVKRYTSKQSTIGLVQNIKCDVLQNLAMQIEGGKDKVLDVIKSINWDQINAMIGK